MKSTENSVRLLYVWTVVKLIFKPSKFKKMKRKLIIPFLLLLGLIVYACSDDQTEALEQQESVLTEQKFELSTSTRFVNRSNPRDEVGTIHNEVLREFASKELESGLSHGELIEEIKAIVVTKSGRLGAYGITDTGFDEDQISRVYEDYSNRYANIVAESRLSESAKSYAQQVIDLTFDPDVTYEGFIDKVTSLENELIASRASGSKSMSDSDYNQMLDLSSIARHSAQL